MRATRSRTLAWWLAAGWLGLAMPAAAGSGEPAAASSPEPAPLSLRDDWGRGVSLAAPPARIVSLAPHATELLFASGVGGRVVAVDRDSDHPPAVAALPRVASYPRPDVERLLSFAPDLIVIWGPGARRAQLERLEALGLTVFVSDPRTLDDVAATIERFARLSGDPGPGLSAARAFRDRLARIRARHATLRPVRVFVQIWSSPLISIGDRDVIGDAVRSCGGHNVFGNAPVAAPRLDPEAAIAARPELVLATDGTRSEARWRDRGLLAPRGAARFAAFDASTMERPGPRVLDALERLCAEIDGVRRAAG